MELDKIEILLEKYFDAETTIAEEQELMTYFGSQCVAQHLEHYKPMFGFFSEAKEQKSQHVIPLQTKTRNVAWLSIAASVIVLLGVATFTFMNYESATSQELGTYEDPEVAFRETQKALSLLSNNVNVGVESVQYIQEYENAKNKVFTIN